MGLMSSFVSPGSFMEKVFVEKILGGEKLLRLFEESLIKFPEEQRKTLEEIIRENEGTRWGREHGFAEMSADNWAQQPIVTYAEVEPYVGRMRRGDLHSLSAEPPFVFALTSGTTATPKFIPITPKSADSQNYGSNVWNLNLRIKHGEDLGKILFLSGSERIKQTEILPINSFTSLVRKKQNKILLCVLDNQQ